MINQPVVFVIDDDIDDQEIFGIALDRASKNANCVFANDGIHAIEKIKNDESFIPDFIFLDMNMPRMDGTECLVELRKIPRLNHIPVYLYSTSLDNVGISKSKSLGATDYIMKPSSVFELSDILKNIIKTKVFTALMIFFTISFLPKSGSAQVDSVSEINALKKLSVTELMNLTVTSVSRTPDGIGFDPQFNERIFSIFQRLHDKQSYSGTGIGLALCKMVVENHHGMIEGHGKVGVGSRFDIVLPASQSGSLGF